MDNHPSQTTWNIAKGFLVLLLAGFSLALLYEMAGRYHGKDMSVKYAVLTMFPAAYLWWLVERLLAHLGVRRSAGYCLLISLALSIWLLVISENFNLFERIDLMFASLWGGLESAVAWVSKILRQPA